MKIVTIPGFTNDIASTVDDAIIMAIYGPEGSGKTRLLATAPGPLGIVPLDRKTRWTINKMAQELGRKDIFMPPDDFIRHQNPIALSLMKEGEAQKYYGEHVKRVMEAAYKLNQHPDVRAVGLDGGAQLWEDILFKHYGRNQRIMPRDRGPANQDMIDFLSAMTGKHFILSLKAKEEWKDDKPSGKLQPSGMTNMGYHVTVVVEMMCNKKYNPQVSHKDFQWQFSATIKHCQQDPMLQVPNDDNVLRDEMICFQSLAAMIYPDADQGQFQMEAD
jgi:hypothetical protein